jgi:hypothetical protein
MFRHSFDATEKLAVQDTSVSPMQYESRFEHRGSGSAWSAQFSTYSVTMMQAPPQSDCFVHRRLQPMSLHDSHISTTVPLHLRAPSVSQSSGPTNTNGALHAVESSPDSSSAAAGTVTSRHGNSLCRRHHTDRGRGPFLCRTARMAGALARDVPGYTRRNRGQRPALSDGERPPPHRSIVRTDRTVLSRRRDG